MEQNLSNSMQELHASCKFTMKFPALYKKSGTGAIQEWEISVVYQSELVPPDGGSEPELPTIVTIFGLQNGKKQVASEIIRSGKNTGRANATTAEQQAIAEATSKWELQKKKKGYVESVEAALAGEVDALVQGGIFPMLATRFEKRADKVTYPAFIQPKFDGHRCIGIVKDGVGTLWSRTRKQIHTMPHIERAIVALARGQDAVFDGELYNHEYHKDFEKITSLIRPKAPVEGYEKVKFYVYDMPSIEEAYATRQAVIAALFTNLAGEVKPALEEVETRLIDDEDDAILAFEEFFGKGYEGAMLRSADGKYLSHSTRRSNDLLKIKRFDDAEFEIVGIKEGRGKMAGRAIFECKAGNGELFDAKMKGPLEKLKQYWENPAPYIGAIVTVQFQGFTAANKVPRFPVALRFREDL